MPPNSLLGEADKLPAAAMGLGMLIGGEKGGSKWFLRGAVVAALASAYLYSPLTKTELLALLRETLVKMQSLRDYGPLGLVAFIGAFVVYLAVCLPGTMVVDLALGNIYGAPIGTLASVVAKTLSALVALVIGRVFGKVLGLELPELLKSKLGTLKTHPLKTLLAARLAPISTGVKNYALSLIPPEDLPIPQYILATIFANLLVTTGVCVMGASADTLVEALDQAVGHR